MSRVYLDACSIIYLVEATNPFHEVVGRRVLREQNKPSSILITSRLSCLECRIRPLRQGDTSLLQTYDRLFDAAGLELVDISAEIIECATLLRAPDGFSTPDAIHLASAIGAGADIFLTGDAALAKCTEIAVEVLEMA